MKNNDFLSVKLAIILLHLFFLFIKRIYFRKFYLKDNFNKEMCKTGLAIKHQQKLIYE